MFMLEIGRVRHFESSGRPIPRVVLAVGSAVSRKDQDGFGEYFFARDVTQIGRRDRERGQRDGVTSPLLRAIPVPRQDRTAGSGHQFHS